jgi:hypothetical protein
MDKPLGSKRELPSSGLMSASAGCGHAVALGYVREVPKYAGRRSLAASSDAAGNPKPFS